MIFFPSDHPSFFDSDPDNNPRAEATVPDGTPLPVGGALDYKPIKKSIIKKLIETKTERSRGALCLGGRILFRGRKGGGHPATWWVLCQEKNQNF